MFLSSMPKVNSYLSQVLAVQQRRNFSGILSEIIKIHMTFVSGYATFIIVSKDKKLSYLREAARSSVS